jgi:hypothetical protein
VSVGVVAVLEVVAVELVVGMLALVLVLEVLVEVDEFVVDEEAVVASVEVVWWRQSLPASSAIVLAPWLRLLRSVGLIVTGSVRTSLPRIVEALSAAPQLPFWTAETIWSACPLSAFD